MKRLFLTLCALLTAFSLSAAAESEKYESTEITVRCDTEYEGVLREAGKGSFLAATNPRRGELVLNENGRFSYTPKKNFSGKDYFGYRVRDEKGNISQEKTVIIRVIKPEKSSFPRRNGRRLP